MLPKQGLALDIDDTLSWTLGHYIDILQAKFGNPENLSKKELMQKYQAVHRIPFWQTPEALKWTEAQIHSNTTQEAIPLIKDANVIVRKIHALIPVTMYLTSRPPGVLAGTERWLEKHRFPQAPVVVRPASRKRHDGNAWKAEMLERMHPQLMGIIDDNPELVRKLSPKYNGFVILYGRSESPKKHMNIFPSKTWDDVLAVVNMLAKTHGT